MTPGWIKGIETAHKERRKIRRLLGSGAVRDASSAKKQGRPAEREVRHGLASHPFVVRLPSSDVDVFKQVFVDTEYRFDSVENPRVIIDAGANIGLTSVYYASCYPECRILAIEPERSNFGLLSRNVALYPNVIPIHAALASEPGRVVIDDPDQGAWSFRTRSAQHADPGSQRVDAVTIGQLMDEHGIERIDLLKMDIEGAEMDVMRHASAWIDRVDAMVIELHERFMRGCTRVFYDATPGFDHEWHAGEHIWISRDRGARTIRESAH